jgi:hypothetical protein
MSTPQEHLDTLRTLLSGLSGRDGVDMQAIESALIGLGKACAQEGAVQMRGRAAKACEVALQIAVDRGFGTDVELAHRYDAEKIRELDASTALDLVPRTSVPAMTTVENEPIRPRAATSSGDPGHPLLDALGRFERSVARAAALHSVHMDKAMPAADYETFTSLRDDVIPALRKEIMDVGSQSSRSDEVNELKKQIGMLKDRYTFVVDNLDVVKSAAANWHPNRVSGLRDWIEDHVTISMVNRGMLPLSARSVKGRKILP